MPPKCHHSPLEEALANLKETINKILQVTTATSEKQDIIVNQLANNFEHNNNLLTALHKPESSNTKDGNKTPPTHTTTFHGFLMPPIDDAVRSRPIDPRLEAAMAKYYPDYTSYSPPPTSKSPPLKESILADTIANLDDDPHTLELFNHWKRRANQWDTNTSTITTTPTSKQPIIPPPPKNHGLEIHHPKPMAKSLIASASSMTKIQNDVPIQTRVFVSSLIKDMLAIFCYMETFPPGHQSHPPKLVFIQTEPEPPWKPCHTWYKYMSLEDKARFQAWGIDTFLSLASNPSSMHT